MCLIFGSFIRLALQRARIALAHVRGYKTQRIISIFVVIVVAVLIVGVAENGVRCHETKVI